MSINVFLRIKFNPITANKMFSVYIQTMYEFFCETQSIETFHGNLCSFEYSGK